MKTETVGCWCLHTPDMSDGARLFGSIYPAIAEEHDDWDVEIAWWEVVVEDDDA